MTAADPIPSCTVYADDLIGIDALSIRARLLLQAGRKAEFAAARGAIDDMWTWRHQNPDAHQDTGYGHKPPSDHCGCEQAA